MLYTATPETKGCTHEGCKWRKLAVAAGTYIKERSHYIASQEVFISDSNRLWNPPLSRLRSLGERSFTDAKRKVL